MLEYSNLGDSRVTNYLVNSINSTALRPSWSGPIIDGVTSYNITVELNGAEVASYSIDMNIGILPNYEDQELIIGGLSPFTNYLVTVTALFTGSPGTPFSVSQITNIAGNRSRI